jgi:broad specificity phosphatase PhoE
MTKITLIRHGKPCFELTGKAQAKELQNIIKQYDLSGISDEPPQQSKEMAASCDVVVCSDFKRSIESAMALGFADVDLSDPMFREVALPHFKGGLLTMSVAAWSVLMRCLSVVGFSQQGESLSMAKNRAKKAASVLIDMAQHHDSVLLVGHGFINYFIAQELLARQWKGASKPGTSYWEYGVYHYEESSLCI